jgi:hypothetical protein
MSAKLMKALRFARFGATLSLAISVPRSNPAFGFPALPAIFRRFNLARQVRFTSLEGLPRLRMGIKKLFAFFGGQI